MKELAVGTLQTLGRELARNRRSVQNDFNFLPAFFLLFYFREPLNVKQLAEMKKLALGTLYRDNSLGGQSGMVWIMHAYAHERMI